MKKLLMVAKRIALTNKVRILFSKFLCAGGRVMRNQIKKTEAVKVKMKPKKLTPKVYKLGISGTNAISKEYAKMRHILIKLFEVIFLDYLAYKRRGFD